MVIAAMLGLYDAACASDKATEVAYCDQKQECMRAGGQDCPYPPLVVVRLPPYDPWQ